MQFTTLFVAASALVAGASAHYNGTVVYTTEVHTAYTTVCPEATEVSFNGVTYTVSEATTLTITNCPCTVVKPVTTYSSVYCSTCPSAPAAPPVYVNSTGPAAPAPPAATTSAPVAVGTGAGVPSASSTPFLPANSGNRVVVASGAGLAGLLGLAAYIL
ncbi:hypothetical protein B7463_g11314, partial [Scytalidium lignicola]